MKYDGVKTEDGSIARYREWPGWSFASKFTSFAEDAGSSQEGFDALLEVLKMGNSVGEFDQDLFDDYERAIELILEKHREKKLRNLCAQVRVSKQSENFLRTLMVEGDSNELRAEACFFLGRLLSQKRDMCLPNSWAKRPGVGAFGEYSDSRVRANLDRFLANQDIEQLQSEAIRCFKLVTSDYPDVPTARGDEKLSDRARREIYELRHLAIGVTAPDIVGADVDGKPMRLSDHRGKVVLLVFWASWCGPCIGDIPHEKELYAKFVDRPFVIVGVNADDTLTSAQDSVRDNAIPWRSFWNGPDGIDGPITTNWNVRAWPTVYVLDPEGTIRFKHLRREELGEPLEQLVTETETNVSKQR
ncbi:TlpA disulfide reductase family protein [Novipirellula rosea]|uniref:TlpA family protein disulfide reductase n=1 Tax=Novipirellula rosea TaxID=1031540 RepID=UPI0031ECC5A8